MPNHIYEHFLLKNGKNILLKNCEPKFAQQFIGFAAQIATESTHTLKYEGRRFCAKEISKEWETALNSNSQLFLGGFDQDRLIAYLVLKRNSPDHPWIKHTAEFCIMLLQEYCSQGLGSKMIQLMENFARIMSITRLEAQVKTKNLKGISLYLKHGYEIEGMKRQAVLINGEFENDYYIAKIF